MKHIAVRTDYCTDWYDCASKSNLGPPRLAQGVPSYVAKLPARTWTTLDIGGNPITPL